jgi:hypothetical protein
MQRLEAAAIHMYKNLKDIEFIFPKEIDIEAFAEKSSFEPYSEEVVNYLDVLSKELNKDPNIRVYPDVATFSFFCRRANILSIKKKYLSNNFLRLGRGLLFHIAPSNVPVNFAYSLVSGLLAGNLNIVRVPSKNFEQIEIISKAIDRVSKKIEHEFISSRIVLVRYDRLNSATSYFSSLCDVRIIWGGDETISQIRENKIPPRSFDITFADRYSLCAINADEYVNEKYPNKIAQGFYNDTYLFDQNACTAPHLLIWLGTKDNVNKAKRIFWDSLYDFVKLNYEVQPVIAVDKLTSFYNQSVHMNEITKSVTPDNLIWRVELKHLLKNIDEFRCNSGYFSEFHATSLSEINKIIDKKYQTLAYYGISKDELNEFMKYEKPQGIDRIVPIGRTSDFSLNWDGIDLIKTLSRVIEIK